MAEPQKSILIAEIGAAHGVRGEVRVKAHTADPMAIADYGPLRDGRGSLFRVKSLRHLKDDMLVVAFEGVADRTAAEKLNRTKLYVDRSALPPPDEDEFYHADLLGLAVETTAGEPVGTVVAVADFGAGDLLEVRRSGGASIYVPFTRAVVPVLDFSAGKAIIEPPQGLLEEGGEPEGEDAP
ncbi:Ribosome maturation factor RimM [uncultured Pleomorphomonas sp.]|uniref:Ribosome maturation factor RimM n=1 Tax=uncultured Pleomorphomonas sp. TaxID=442121 RepID=A0A212LK44_9HYPH|nr:ribosome maturation factor RimM [uncultured Pleomorphomonas sp.]SCM77915.1 Ribosome maturation factor RimM [uncultured Pleomorphomonas sp.]